jgi:hypothetical protein
MRHRCYVYDIYYYLLLYVISLLSLNDIVLSLQIYWKKLKKQRQIFSSLVSSNLSYEYRRALIDSMFRFNTRVYF